MLFKCKYGNTRQSCTIKNKNVKHKCEFDIEDKKEIK